ncbi:MAG: ornithine cyclodeaminase [Gemmatimonadota bacterium]
MELRVLTEGDLRQALDMPAAIQAVRQAFVALSGGGARVPVRQRIEGPGATLLSMPGTLSAPGSLGAKLVTVAPDNRRRGLPAIHAVVVLLDPTTGVPRALLDGEWLTALRLAEEAAGAGVEGVRAVATAAEAIRGAQIVVTATDSSEPVLDPDALEPTVLINAVGGYRRDMQEVPTVVTARARVVVDQVEAALREAGDVWIPCEAGVLRPEELEELGALAALTGGETPGAEARPGVTLFKSVGNAVQDLAVAALALERAEALGLGTVVRG